MPVGNAIATVPDECAGPASVAQAGCLAETRCWSPRYGFLFPVAETPYRFIYLFRFSSMPGVRFAEVRSRVGMAQVLALLQFIPCEGSNEQVRGPCPVHGSTSPKNRCFSANLKKNVYRCFRCGSAGNQLDLYAAATCQSLLAAAIDLCERAGCEVPWLAPK